MLAISNLPVPAAILILYLIGAVFWAAGMSDDYRDNVIQALLWPFFILLAVIIMPVVWIGEWYERRRARPPIS